MKKYPFPYFLAFLTYAFILFIEKVAFNSHALIEHDHGDEAPAPAHKDRSKIELDDRNAGENCNRKFLLCLKNLYNLFKIFLTLLKFYFFRKI